ncbi:hypothetical protein ACS0TY_000711 [Phlomoides rotata]
MKKLSLGPNIGNSGRSSAGDDEDDEASKEAIASYQAREEEIERRKMEVRRRLESQLNRAEEEAKRLTQVWEELEVFTDPMRKEVNNVRRRLEVATRDLKSLAQICQKKEKEYKEALETFQEKSNERAQLTTALVEVKPKFQMEIGTKVDQILN